VEAEVGGLLGAEILGARKLGHRELVGGDATAFIEADELVAVGREDGRHVPQLAGAVVQPLLHTGSGGLALALGLDDGERLRRDAA
jgi:hypothetical protein